MIIPYRPVNNATSVMSLIKNALEHRCESATFVHEHSSRSHLVVMVTVTTDITIDKGSPSDSPGNQEGQKRKASSTKDGRLWLVTYLSVFLLVDNGSDT